MNQHEFDEGVEHRGQGIDLRLDGFEVTSGRQYGCSNPALKTGQFAAILRLCIEPAHGILGGQGRQRHAPGCRLDPHLVGVGARELDLYRDGQCHESIPIAIIPFGYRSGAETIAAPGSSRFGGTDTGDMRKGICAGILCERKPPLNQRKIVFFDFRGFGYPAKKQTSGRP
ncbi:hypothetical protein AFE_1632 [Acidithiobacillus ferrooxidans ATCC 23270]|uniref:Uncharacterized protein n=1 Tax=Acidithiobacillus ferrooxidans (strain ATCC 23270 / DSM 14882 / CIP 104768 / NCIMB 8455) TaxID=243159 RepID=B7JAX2_ACIF2|nr:hypothetical protein AFE_1632 [Acidithiobacillus ferrooxidans ATCC 23270]